MPEAAAAYVAEFFAFTLEAGATATAIAATVTEIAVTAAITTAVSSVLGSSGQGGTAAVRSLNTTIRQAAAPRRLIYGTVKAGGLLAYPAQSSDGKYTDFAIPIGEGPIDGVETVIWIGDELSTEPKFDGLVTITPYLGAAGQTASAALIAASGGEWTSDAVGRGVAWVHVRYEWDRNAFPRGLVFPAFTVRGRVLYDPRTSTTAHSSNPALALLDYIRSEYGYAAPDAFINFDSFAAAAAVCDEVLDSLDTTNTVGGVPGNVRRYTLDGVFECTASPSATVATMCAAMGGALVFVRGQYHCYAGAWRAPTGPTLTAEYLRGDPSLRTHPTRQQRINTARGTYRDPRQDWQTVSYPQRQLAAAVVAEAGEIVQGIDYPATTCGAIAQRLAKLAMMQSRSAVPMSLPCNYAAWQWQLFDTVTVNIPEIGADGVYLITNYTYPPAGGIDLVLVPHLANDFAWDHTTDEVVTAPLVVPSFNSNVPAITDLVVSGAPVYTGGDGASIGLSATWSNGEWVFLKHYEVQYKRSADADWISSYSPTLPAWSIFGPIVAGTEYDVRVRVVADDDRTSDWATETNIEATADTTPPGVPTALSVTHAGGAAPDVIAWTTPAEVDFSRSRVYANSANDAPTATEIAEIFGLPGTAYTTTNTHDAGGTYYWVASVDRTGNASARTYAGTA